MKTRSWILLLACLAALLLCLSLLAHSRTPERYAEVYSDGRLVQTIDLSVDGEYRVAWGSVWNTLTVRKGKIGVSAASCASQDCVRCGFHNHGAPIVCLPNRLVISFVEKSEIDALIG